MNEQSAPPPTEREGVVVVDKRHATGPHAAKPPAGAARAASRRAQKGARTIAIPQDAAGFVGISLVPIIDPTTGAVTFDLRVEKTPNLTIDQAARICMDGGMKVLGQRIMALEELVDQKARAEALAEAGGVGAIVHASGPVPRMLQ